MKTDIYSFHAELRSICDSIAKAIRIAADKPGQLSESFNKLKEFCKNKRARAVNLIGENLTDFVNAADWFEVSRSFRDQIIHYERDVHLCLTDKTASRRLLFRTVIGDRTSDVYTGPVQFRYREDGWIFFAPYADYYFGRLWCFLNEMCRLIGQRLTLPKSGFSWVHPWLPVALDHVAQAVELLDRGTEVCGDYISI